MNDNTCPTCNQPVPDPDEALIEKMAEAMYAIIYKSPAFECSFLADLYRELARAALAVVREHDAPAVRFKLFGESKDGPPQPVGVRHGFGSMLVTNPDLAKPQDTAIYRDDTTVNAVTLPSTIEPGDTFVVTKTVTVEPASNVTAAGRAFIAEKLAEREKNHGIEQREDLFPQYEHTSDPDDWCNVSLPKKDSTGAERYFASRMTDPEYREGYEDGLARMAEQEQDTDEVPEPPPWLNHYRNPDAHNAWRRGWRQGWTAGWEAHRDATPAVEHLTVDEAAERSLLARYPLAEWRSVTTTAADQWRRVARAMSGVIVVEGDQ